MSKNKFFNNNYQKLVKFNLKKVELSNINVLDEIDKYLSKLDNWDIYPWNTEIIKKKSRFNYPNTHPNWQKVLDICNKLDINNILEVGSGNGKITKMLYHQLNIIKKQDSIFHCLEGKQEHINEMIKNFKKNKNTNNITLPNIDVKANFFKGYSQKMKFKDNEFDLVFTCTVMMHQPFIPALLTLCECSRVTKKYVLHVENKNYDPNNKNYRHNTICLPKNNNLSDYNKLPLDYKAIYEYMGFKTLEHYDYYDYNVKDALYTVYLGEKKNNK